MSRERRVPISPLLFLALSCTSAFDLAAPAFAFGSSLASIGRQRKSCATFNLQMMSTSASERVAPRIELFFKTNAELKERVRFLASRGYKSYSLVNKNKDDKTLEWCKAAMGEVPGASVCVHYSLKYNKAGGRKPPADQAEALSYGMFRKHLDKMKSMGLGDGAETLLISGSGPKAPLDSVKCLQLLGKDVSTPQASCERIGVAFNPYILDEKLAEEERVRVKKKLESGTVSSVWLQFGSDARKLEGGLKWLASLGDLAPKRTVGSLFLPTAKLIAQQKFRPWNGVHLSEEYLSGTDGAHKATLLLLDVYNRFGVEVLVEAPGVRNEKDLDVLEGLLGPPQVGEANGVVAKEEKGVGQEEKEEVPVLKRPRPSRGKAV